MSIAGTGTLLDRVEHIMGMPIGIDVRDQDVDAAALERAFDWFRWVDATFSTYKDDSAISRLNRGEVLLEDLNPTLREVLARCEQLRFETSGYFDIHLDSDPSIVDPSGLVKGWSVDRAAAILEEAGARNYSINAGGDIRVRGGALPDASWRIGIQHPYLRDKVAAVVVGDDLAIATSGTYERGNHILNPHTGLPPGGVLSVTIVGPDLGTADAYATAAFAMGDGAPAWTAGLIGSGYEAMTILADERVVSTPGFPATPSDASTN